MIMLGFSCLVTYHAIMYFIIDPRMTLEMFYLPSLFHGFGYTIHKEKRVTRVTFGSLSLALLM